MPQTQQTIDERFRELAQDTLHHAHVDEMSAYVQHGNTSTLEHSMAVAYWSLAMARRLHARCDEASLVRGALLHDYYLYDWHDHEAAPTRWHGFTHPRIALENAKRDFELDERTRDLILHHMFPLVPVPPHHREGAIVCIVDKGCSLVETFRRGPWATLTPQLDGGARR